LKVVVCVGTRPDIIKMWGPYKALKNTVETILIHSEQHADAVSKPILQAFGMVPDRYCLMDKPDKSNLYIVNSYLIHDFGDHFGDIKPDLVLVHGDTVTAVSAALAAFQLNIPIGHVEAGLRTSRYEYPFPEEGYRRIISRITKLHFAPTQKAAMNLRAEGINQGVFVTGNTVVDALNIEDDHFYGNEYFYHSHEIILVTCHRRESYGEPLEKLCHAISKLAIGDKRFIVWPVHQNPNISNLVTNQPCLAFKNIDLQAPMSYQSFIHTLRYAKLVITDSGGVMEEAAVLGKPTIVLRTETERPEVLDLPNVRLVGYDFEELINLADEWLRHPPNVEPSTAFGDGTAGEEIAELCSRFIG
jgi:UDP-N-acetylglucosamine 2-epimerase (non-hydrolysing)